MWFKNLQIYRLKDVKLDASLLEENLSKMALAGCGSSEMQSRGWVPPKGEGEKLVHVLGKQMLIALGVEKKLLPASVVNQHARARAEQIEEQQGYRPGRKQLREIKEQVAIDLLPRAFVLRRTTFAWIDPVGGWFVVDAGAAARADELIETLLKSTTDLQLAMLKTRTSPLAAMTGWLAANEAPPGFTIDRDCELRGAGDEKATVRYVRHDLDPAEIKRHLAGGKQATRLALTWSDRISLTLTENLQIKKLVPLDIVKQEADSSAEDADELFDADFALMTGELSHLLPDLIAALGGEEG